MYQKMVPGLRVAVPFGKSKIYTGLVLELHDNPPQLYEAKEIGQLLDELPIVTELQLKHWLWIASYYMCSIGDVYRGAMPSAFLLESETVITSSVNTIENEDLSDEEYLIREAFSKASSLSVQDISKILGKKHVFPVIHTMLQRNLLSIREEITEAYRPKMVRYIKLADLFDDTENLPALLEELRNAKKQKEAVLSFFQLKATEKKPVAVKKLLEYSGVGVTVLKSLIDKGIFEEYFLQHDRLIFSGEQRTDEMVLSEPQQTAYEAVSAVFETKEVCLLQGVTASGKTEIYFRLMEEVLQKGRQILFLLPEIALTTQLVGRLRYHFGDKVAVFHSRYSNNERAEVWRHVLENRTTAQIVIGARSSLFLPFRNLGLIVIDEEHEQTFKQYDPAPRYHARDTAIMLASYHQAKVILGSATPSLETRFNAESGKYGLVELTKRYGNVMMPDIIITDLKDKQKKKKMTGHFSDTLQEEIAETLSRGEQVILFQNRRGFSPIVECLDCGHVPQCPQCDVSLTFHKNKGQLRCHYCSYTMAMPTHCHSCSSVNLTTKGFGTEQVEEELEKLFPEARIARMDQDTTRGKYAFEKILDSFRDREIDILAGTQMLAKGLDFDNVGLVGVMNADNMLYYPDFRAQERAFQMLTQVAGRAGRSEKRGKVIIQTYNPHHNIIRHVTANDYATMYHEEIHERRIYKYPPFFRVIRVTLRHRDYEKLRESAVWLAEVLRQNLDMPVLGPEEPPINRIRNEYIRTVMVKIPVEAPLGAVKKRIQKIRNSFEAIPQYRAVKAVINVDFY